MVWIGPWMRVTSVNLSLPEGARFPLRWNGGLTRVVQSTLGTFDLQFKPALWAGSPVTGPVIGCGP